MKFLIAALVLAFTMTFTADAEAGPLRRWNQNRLWSPGIFIHLAREHVGVHWSGPVMVWRGDWVPVSELR